MPLTVAPWRSYVLNDDEEETSFVLIYYDHVQGDFLNNETLYLHIFSAIFISINIFRSNNYLIFLQNLSRPKDKTIYPRNVRNERICKWTKRRSKQIVDRAFEINEYYDWRTVFHI